MPELPEVEMVVRHLRSLLPGRTIIKAQLFVPRLAAEHPARQFASKLKGATVTSVGRRGKHILTHFANGRTLLTHLRMTGRFLYLDQGTPLPKHVSASFALDNGKCLIFQDPRKFGTMLIVPTVELSAAKPLAGLAPEPFEPAFSLAYLRATLERTDQQIKLALLDQTKVLGLGNIYAAEALHRARIHPQTAASTLTKPRLTRLHREIINVLTEAIANDSTMNTDPQDLGASYTDGVYEGMTRVYEREGKPCLTCGSVIRCITQGQRSTYFCPRCQRA